MKQKIKLIRDDGIVVYQGKLLNIPIKEEFIVKRSIEVFGDDDPCIIHQSYVIKLYVNELLELIPGDVNELPLCEVKEHVKFLDIEPSETYTLVIGG